MIPGHYSPYGGAIQTELPRPMLRNGICGLLSRGAKGEGGKDHKVEVVEWRMSGAVHPRHTLLHKAGKILVQQSGPVAGFKGTRI